MPTYKEIALLYTDFIPEHVHLSTWGFDIETLQSHSGNTYDTHVVRALLGALAVLGGSTDSTARGCDFVIWLGDRGKGFWVGVPSSVPDAVKTLLAASFRSVPGYEMPLNSPDFSYLLVPRYRYAQGQVIEYAGELAGTSRTDDEKWYGSGLTIHYRDRVPEGAVEELTELMRRRKSEGLEDGGPKL